MSESRTITEETPKTAARPKRRAWLAVLIVLLATGILVLPLMKKPATPAGGSGGMGPGGPPGGMPGMSGNATPIETATVKPEPMNVYIDSIGTVTPEHTASIYSQVSGQLLAVNYREGQMVKQGQSLVEVDTRPYQAQLDQAKGTLARDQSLLHQAETDEQRYQAADKLEAISKQTLFDQQATVEQYKASVQNDLASIRYYEVQLGYCHITAPFSGRVGLRLVDPGNTIFSGASNTLAVITQLDPITVVFSVPEDDVDRVQKQLRQAHSMKVDLYDRTQNKQISAGELIALDNQVDTTTGTVKFRARFRNSDSALFPNQFVNARLLVSTLPRAQVLPTSVIQYNGQQAFVYVVDRAANTVSLKNITVTNESGEKSAVDGLAEGTAVAASNFDRLQDGAKVMITGGGMPRGGAAPAGMQVPRGAGQAPGTAPNPGSMPPATPGGSGSGKGSTGPGAQR